MKKNLFSPFVFVALLVLGLALMLIGHGEGLGAVGAKAKRAVHVTVYHVGVMAYAARASIGEALRGHMARQGAVLYAFQTTVGANIGFGVIGELAFDGPTRAQPAVISHGTAADIVIGRWFTLAADGTARPGGTGAIGGVLFNPKEYALTGANSLAPSLTLLTGTVGSFLYMGAVIIAAPAAVAIGDVAKYNTTTGIIGVGAPGAGEAAIPNSKFIRYPNAAPGLAVLELTN